MNLVGGISLYNKCITIINEPVSVPLLREAIESLLVGY